MRNRAVAISATFYAAVAALLLGVLFVLWSDVFPKAISGRIGHNSEAYVTVLAVAAWIQFVRPKLTGARAEWIVTALVGLAFAGLTVYTLVGSMPSRFATLNEGTLAAALLIPYVQLRRPFPRRAALWTLIVGVVLTIATIRTAATVDLAETYGMVLLGIAALDIVDRGILDPTAVTSVTKRWIWYAFLVIGPLVFSFAEYHLHAGSSGIIGTPIRWLVRIDESFIFVIFVEVFFAVGLGRTGSVAVAEPETSPESSVPTKAATV